MRMKQWVNYATFFVLLLLPWQTRWIFKQISLLGEPVSLGSLSLYVTQVLILVLFLSVTVLAPKIHDREFLIDNGSRQRTRIAVTVLLLGFLGLLLWKSIHVDLVLVYYSTIGFAALFGVILMHPWIERKTILAGVSLSLVLPVLLGLYQVGAGSSAASTLLGLAARDAQVLGDSVFFLGGERILRAYGSFPHPNIFAGYLLVGIWCAWRWLREEVKWSRGREIQVVAGIVLVLLLIGLLATGSQAAWLGAFIAGIWIFVEQKVVGVSEYRATVFIGTAFLGIVSIWAGDGASFLERQDQYQQFFAMMSLSDLLTGIGPLQYIFHLSKSMPGFAWWQYQPVHNTGLLVMSEIGVIGSGLLSYIAWPKLKSLFTSRHFPLLLALVPPLFLDHYLWSTWAGLTIVILLFSLDAKRSNH